MKLKRILASLLALTVIGACTPATLAGFPESAINANAEVHYADVEIEYTDKDSNLKYVIDDGTIEITECDDKTVSSIEIPAEINGHKVTSIRDWAFSGCKFLTEIIIPESVTSIGYYAFGDTPWLENKQKENPLVIVNGILIDGKTCTGDVVIPDSVTSVNEYAFSRCTGMTKVTIPDSVTSIGERAFSECSGLKSITIPDSVTSIDEDVFDETPWLENKRKKNPIVVVNGILVDGQTCSGDVVIPNGVKSICDYAFFYCREITSLVIPDSVTNIGVRAFDSCDGMTSLTLSRGLTSIDYAAFSHCSSLTEITIPDCVTCIECFTFSDTQWIKNKRKENPLVIVNGTIIDGTTCSGDVVIPDGVTGICCNAFSDCSKLTSVVIPDSLTNIGESAFEKCSGLTSLTLSRGVTRIGWRAFYQCSGLTEIIIPDNITDIDFYTFASTQWIENKRKETPLVIVNGILIDGKTCSGDVVVPDTVNRIGPCAFLNCQNTISSITFPESVSIIGDSAFSLSSEPYEITILNPECEIIYDCGYGILIKGYSGSTAQEYAKKNFIEFESLGETPAPEIAMGDANGDNSVDSIDATVVLVDYSMTSTGKESNLTDAQKAAADVDKDGKIDSSDASIILQFYAYISTGGTETDISKWMTK